MKKFDETRFVKLLYSLSVLYGGEFRNILRTDRIRISPFLRVQNGAVSKGDSKH